MAAFQDEARVGQKNKITRRWAKRGTRPSAPRDQRTASAYIFGAICPAEGKGAGLVLPSCNSEAWPCISRKSRSQSRLILLDQAGWHVSKKLPVPGNMTLVPLPPKEYVLPIRIDDTELDGLLPTISYVPIAMGVERIGNLLIQKLQL
jgi:hypothetical protein